MEQLEMFEKGGPAMVALLFCSVCVLTIAVERFSFYRQIRKGLLQFIDRLPAVLHTDPLRAAYESCEKETCMAGYVAAAGVKAAIDKKDVNLAMETAYNDAAMQLRSRLNYLSMIVTLSPLLGLLGTISGMIQSFNVFSVQAGQPLAITGGIGEALIATATGLCVAILALIIHAYFSQKLDEVLVQLDKSMAIVQDEMKQREAVGHAA